MWTGPARRILRLTLFALLLGCAKKKDDPAATTIADSPPPSMPMSRFLGRRRADVEGLLGPRKDSTDDGWVAYGGAWSLHYEHGCAVQLRARFSPGKPCNDAVDLIGFADAGPPIRRSDHCGWTDISGRHSLAPNVRATYDIKTSTLVAKRTDGAAACQ